MLIHGLKLLCLPIADSDYIWLCTLSGSRSRSDHAAAPKNAESASRPQRREVSTVKRALGSGGRADRAAAPKNAKAAPCQQAQPPSMRLGVGLVKGSGMPDCQWTRTIMRIRVIARPLRPAPCPFLRAGGNTLLRRALGRGTRSEHADPKNGRSRPALRSQLSMCSGC